MGSADPVSASPFETNNTDHGRRRKDRPARTSARKPLNAKRVDLAAPTPERLAKGDVVKTMGGHHRAPPVMERMRDRSQFCPGDPFTNEQMFRAAEKLGEYFEAAGLGAGVRAQDLNRLMSGSGDPPHGMPLSEGAAHCRKEFRLALKLMGWFDAYPLRGAGRITAAVVCYDVPVKEAAATYRPGGSNEARLGAGMDALREGLFALAVHWKLLRA